MTPQPPVSPVGELSEELTRLVMAAERKLLNPGSVVLDLALAIKASTLREAAQVAREYRLDGPAPVSPYGDGWNDAVEEVAKAIEGQR